LRKRALRNRAHSDRKSVDVKTKTEGAVFDKSALCTCVTRAALRRNRSSRDNFSRRIASDDPGLSWTRVTTNEIENKVGKTKGEQRKKERIYDGVSRSNARVIIGQIAMRTDEL